MANGRLKILLFVAAVLMSGCVSHQYYPSTYADSMQYFRTDGSNFKDKTVVLKVFRTHENERIWDNDLFRHLAILLERQGAEVVSSQDIGNNDSESEDQVEISERALRMEVTSHLSWEERSNWDNLFNIFTYGCYPDQKNRWYETEVKTQIGDELLFQESFQALMIERTSWCYYLYSHISSWAFDTKSSEDYLALNTMHFDRFVSHTLYKSMQLSTVSPEVARK